ncbi:MAG: ABC transporter ATP-binding protein [Candidatus Micrarchaeaceae archaeon]|jgi:putative ABC transport system ATP-binding protein|nr:ABC transporter ATP-binding protein [Candidatus Micrarchaeota archaeon]HII09536.1 ABC transporter ATP-binding protein [Candidatus Micrarchaeota archaeon]
MKAKPDHSVVVKNVSKAYKSESVEVDALIDVSFYLERGEFVAIIGPSGSGKSTLMHILGTIDKPTSGEVYIDGVATSEMDGDKLAEFRNKKLGFVFQAYNLVNGLNAEMNVELPLLVSPMSGKDRKERADEVLEQLGLGRRLKQKPNQLSGGQQQRVAIARALINKPALILADEPTGNLDTKAGDEVIKLFRDITKEQNVTIVMVTHNVDITRYCNRVIHIKDGRLEKIEVLR